MTKSARYDGPEAGGMAPGSGFSPETSPADAWSSGFRPYGTNPPTASAVSEAPLSPPHDFDPPRSSLGKFHFLERIGRGGMGEVHLALLSGPTGFSKLVVVKLLREDFAAYESIREMFLDEGRLAARLNHPNVVQTNEVGVEAGKHYLVMEYLEGQPLDRLIKRARETGGGVPPGLWARIALDSLAGLDYAHELTDYDGTPLNVVHRDLSPHNIFLTYEGVTKLLDFGIAKAATQSAQTQAGTIKGKPAYMPPEQLMGLPVDRRADIFVFGIVLWEMFTGTRLFNGTLNECLKRVTGGPLPRISSVMPGFDPGLEAVVARALERDSDARYQTAREMREALAAAAAQLFPIPPQEAVGELMRALFRERREQRRLAVQRYVSERLRNPMSPRGLAGLPGPHDPSVLASTTGVAAPTPPTGVAWTQTPSAMQLMQAARGERPMGATPGDGTFVLQNPGEGMPNMAAHTGLPPHLTGGYPAQPSPFASQSTPFATPTPFSQSGPYAVQSGRYVVVDPSLIAAPQPAGSRAMFWVSLLLGASTLAAAGSLVLVLTLSHRGSSGQGGTPAAGTSQESAPAVGVASVNAAEPTPPSPSEPAADSAEPAASGSAPAQTPPAAASAQVASASTGAKHEGQPAGPKHDSRRPPLRKGHESTATTAAPPPAPPPATAAPPAPRASQDAPKRPPGRTFRTDL